MARQLTTRRSKKTLRQQGFTLIELMVVTAIAGVLGAVSIPKFLDARKASETKAIIAEQVGLGKECSTYVTAGGTASGMPAPDGCSATGGSFAKSMSNGGTMVAGVICLEPTATGTGTSDGMTSLDTHTTVTINVADTGAMSCALTA